jgi:hypothetical protein
MLLRCELSKIEYEHDIILTEKLCKGLENGESGTLFVFVFSLLQNVCFRLFGCFFKSGIHFDYRVVLEKSQK